MGKKKKVKKAEQTEHFKKRLDDLLEKATPEEAKTIEDGMNAIIEDPYIGRPIRKVPTEQDLELLRSYIGKPITKAGWWDNRYEEPVVLVDFDVEWPDRILEIFAAEVYTPEKRIIGLDNILGSLKDILRNDYMIRNISYNAKDEQLHVSFGKDSDEILIRASGWDLEDNPPKTIL